MLPALAKVMICDDLMIMIFYIILPCLPPWPLQSRSNSPGVAQSHASDRASVLDGGIKPSQSSKIPWAHSNGDGSKPVITMFEGITIYYPNYPNIFILRLATQGSFSNTRICRSESPKCLMKSCWKKAELRQAPGAKPGWRHPPWRAASDSAKLLLLESQWWLPCLSH